MHIFCLAAGDIRLCRVVEAHLGMMCLKVVVKFITAKGGLWLDKEGNQGQHQHPGEQAGGRN